MGGGWIYASMGKNKTGEGRVVVLRYILLLTRESESSKRLISISMWNCGCIRTEAKRRFLYRRCISLWLQFICFIHFMICLLFRLSSNVYWNSHFSCRFRTVAYLQQIWWLEVDGDLEFQFPEGTYSLFFRLQLGKATKRHKRRAYNYEHVHGWDLKPVQFQLTTQDDCRATSRCYLDNVGTWMQHHVGDFVVKDATVPTKIRFSLTQIDCTHTKGGLCVDSVLICPSSLAKQLSSCWILIALYVVSFFSSEVPSVV